MIKQTDLPKISVITVCYNSIKTLEQTIQSVINQTYPNIEYIIIDGGSTDGTIDIIKNYEDKIAYWLSESDEGISDAFNKGIKKASGDIIGIINSDDWYEPNAVASVVDTFLFHTNIGFVFGDQNYSDKNGNIMWIQKGDSEFEKSIRYTMPSLPHPTVFVRRTVYQQYGLFNLDYKTAMDYELLLRFVINGVKGLYIPKVLANMRIGGESNVNYLRGFLEVVKASIAYDYPRVFAWLRFLYKSIKTKTRLILQKIGLESIVYLYKTNKKHIVKIQK